MERHNSVCVRERPTATGRLTCLLKHPLAALPSRRPYAADGAGTSRRDTVHARIAALLDAGSFVSWDDDSSPPASTGPDGPGIPDATPHTRRRDAAVRTGSGQIHGHAVALILSDFRFLGGTLGVVEGERVARAFERAREGRLPMLAICASGGVRMQEGPPAFLQMVKTTEAAVLYKRANLLYVVYLGDPTTGGVLASWGSLGSLTFASPRARIGFTGPRIVEMMTGRRSPRGVRSAESLLRHGLIDDVFPVEQLRERSGRLLDVVGAEANTHSTVAIELGPPPEQGDAWRSVLLTRNRSRSSMRDLVDAAMTDITWLKGDGVGDGDDPACLAGLGRFRGIAVVILGHGRGTGNAGLRITSGGLRKARRAMALAGELRLPLVTVIDTPGADTSAASEERGLAREIARCMAAMITVRSPTLALLLGQGSGGAALAMLAADRVVCAQHGWLAPIAPEGASAILYGTTSRAPEVARAQMISSWDLLRQGIVDEVVPEPEGPGPNLFLDQIAEAVRRGLSEIDGSAAQRLAARGRRYRDLTARVSTGASPHPDRGLSA